MGEQEYLGGIPANTFSPIGPPPPVLGTTNEGQQVSTFGNFTLLPDQALIVKVPPVEAGYQNAEMINVWTNPLGSSIQTGSLNPSQTFRGADGYTYYVISSSDPGVANWLNTDGHPDGEVYMRFADLPPGGTTADYPAITTQVVNLADVKSNLPTDFPVVTARQRAAELNLRVLENGYMLDQSRNIGWVTYTLEFDQIKNAMGADEFDSIFGSQKDVPSVMDRIFNSNLRPHILPVAQGMLANPRGAFSALVQNVPLLARDVVLPVLVAIGRVHEAIASGAGLGGLLRVLNQTITDPATSITAGFINARNDLAVAMMNSHSYDPLTSKNWANVGTQLAELGQQAFKVLAEAISLKPPSAASAVTPASAAEATASADASESAEEAAASTETSESAEETAASTETSESAEEATASTETSESAEETAASTETSESAEEATASTDTSESAEETTASTETSESAEETAASTETSESAEEMAASTDTPATSAKAAKKAAKKADREAKKADREAKKAARADKAAARKADRAAKATSAGARPKPAN